MPGLSSLLHAAPASGGAASQATVTGASVPGGQAQGREFSAPSLTCSVACRAQGTKWGEGDRWGSATVPCPVARPLQLRPSGNRTPEAERREGSATLSFPDHGIFQAIVLEWIAISFSRGSFRPRDRTQVSCIVDRCLYRLSHQGSPLPRPDPKFPGEKSFPSGGGGASTRCLWNPDSVLLVLLILLTTQQSDPIWSIFQMGRLSLGGICCGPGSLSRSQPVAELG